MSDFTICQISPDFRCQQISADQTLIHSPFSTPSLSLHRAHTMLTMFFPQFPQFLLVILSPSPASCKFFMCHLEELSADWPNIGSLVTSANCYFRLHHLFAFCLFFFSAHTPLSSKFSMRHSSFQPTGSTMYSPIYIYWPNIKLHHLSRWWLETLPSLVSVTFHQLMVQIQITTDMYFETRCHSGMFGSEQVHCWGSGRPPDWGWDVGGALRAVGGVYAPPYSLLLHPAHLNIGACSRHDSYRGGSYLTLESQDYLKHLNSVCKLFRWDGLMAIHWGQTYPPTSRFPSGFAPEKSFDCWGCSTLFSVSSHIQFPCLH